MKLITYEEAKEIRKEISKQWKEEDKRKILPRAIPASADIMAVVNFCIMRDRKKQGPLIAKMYCIGCRKSQVFKKGRLEDSEGNRFNVYQCPKCGHFEDYELTNIMIEARDANG